METRRRRSGIAKSEDVLNPAMIYLYDVRRLKSELERRGLDTKGNKQKLVERLIDALDTNVDESKETIVVSKAKQVSESSDSTSEVASPVKNAVSSKAKAKTNVKQSPQKRKTRTTSPKKPVLAIDNPTIDLQSEAPKQDDKAEEEKSEENRNIECSTSTITQSPSKSPRKTEKDIASTSSSTTTDVNVDESEGSVVASKKKRVSRAKAVETQSVVKPKTHTVPLNQPVSAVDISDLIVDSPDETVKEKDKNEEGKSEEHQRITSSPLKTFVNTEEAIPSTSSSVTTAIGVDESESVVMAMTEVVSESSGSPLNVTSPPLTDVSSKVKSNSVEKQSPLKRKTRTMSPKKTVVALDTVDRIIDSQAEDSKQDGKISKEKSEETSAIAQSPPKSPRKTEKDIASTSSSTTTDANIDESEGSVVASKKKRVSLISPSIPKVFTPNSVTSKVKAKTAVAQSAVKPKPRTMPPKQPVSAIDIIDSIMDSQNETLKQKYKTEEEKSEERQRIEFEKRMKGQMAYVVPQFEKKELQLGKEISSEVVSQRIVAMRDVPEQGRGSIEERLQQLFDKRGNDADLSSPKTDVATPSSSLSRSIIAPPPGPKPFNAKPMYQSSVHSSLPSSRLTVPPPPGPRPVDARPIRLESMSPPVIPTNLVIPSPPGTRPVNARQILSESLNQSVTMTNPVIPSPPGPRPMNARPVNSESMNSLKTATLIIPSPPGPRPVNARPVREELNVKPIVPPPPGPRPVNARPVREELNFKPIVPPPPGPRPVDARPISQENISKPIRSEFIPLPPGSRPMNARPICEELIMKSIPPPKLIIPPPPGRISDVRPIQHVGMESSFVPPPPEENSQQKDISIPPPTLVIPPPPGPRPTNLRPITSITSIPPPQLVIPPPPGPRPSDARSVTPMDSINKDITQTTSGDIALVDSKNIKTPIPVHNEDPIVDDEPMDIVNSDEEATNEEENVYIMNTEENAIEEDEYDPIEASLVIRDREKIESEIADTRNVTSSNDSDDETSSSSSDNTSDSETSEDSSEEHSEIRSKNMDANIQNQPAGLDKLYENPSLLLQKASDVLKGLEGAKPQIIQEEFEGEYEAEKEDKTNIDFHGEPVPDDEEDDDALFEIAAGLPRKKKEPKPIKEEPLADERFIELDYYNSDFNIKAAPDNKWMIDPDNGDGFALMWGGVRSNYGILIPPNKELPRIAFQVTIVELLSLKHVPFEESDPHDIRIGWSASTSSTILGESQKSYGLCSTQRKCAEGVFNIFGEAFHCDDVVTTVIDIKAQEIIYYKNSKLIGIAFSGNLFEPGDIVYPHICTKNCKVLVNFGIECPENGPENKWSLPEVEKQKGTLFVGNLEISSSLVPSRRPPEQKSDCTVILMVGLPGVGKTTWVNRYIQDHPEEHWIHLNGEKVLDLMKVNGIPRKRLQNGRLDMVLGLCAKALTRSLQLACRRRHNYIIDQTHCSKEARKKRLLLFEGFTRRCVVIIPNEVEAEERRSRRARNDPSGELPVESLLELKATLSLPTTEDEPYDEIIFVEPPLDRISEAIEQVQKYNEEGQPWVRKHKKYKPNTVISDHRQNQQNNWSDNKRNSWHTNITKQPERSNAENFLQVSLGPVITGMNTQLPTPPPNLRANEGYAGFGTPASQIPIPVPISVEVPEFNPAVPPPQFIRTPVTPITITPMIGSQPHTPTTTRSIPS